MTLVRRDPLAREELHRATITSPHAQAIGCSWCGGLTKNHTLYRYWVERDDRNGRGDQIKGHFCSESCRKYYYS